MDHAWTQDRWKYLRREDGSESLFDLLADPHEARDLALFKPQVVSTLRSELENYLKQMAGSLEARTRGATPTEEADLKALGYGGDEDSR